MTVDEPAMVARRIWDAVEEGRDHLYPGMTERFFLLVQRLYPGLIDRDLVKSLRKVAGQQQVQPPL